MRPFLALFIVVAMAAAPLRAADDADRAAIRAIIEQQLDAFQHDDAAKAYGFAAPSIKKMFPDETIFMRMVRDGYGVVYRHKDVLFGESSEAQAGMVQAVRLTDENGDTWLAIYTLEKQPDGSWLISGCILAPQKSDRA
jgi:Domain of unknown function (DUF4864)